MGDFFVGAVREPPLRTEAKQPLVQMAAQWISN